MPRSIRAFATTDRLVLAAGIALVAVAVLADRIAPGDPFAAAGPPLLPPTVTHPMGTDDLGRDVFASVVHGTRTSLVVALAVTAVAATLGVTIGAIAGYRGGLVDDALMRITELVQTVPRFFLAAAVVALLGAGLGRLVAVLGLTTWPAIARVVRAETLTLRERDFVAAARALGAPARRIVVRDVLPNALPAMLVALSVNAGTVILLEAGLAFLGLGDPRVMSLGLLANNAQPFLRVAWWMAVFPGAALAATVIEINLVGDAVGAVLEAGHRR
jgi:peptide/nickel transport system permease protein